MPARRRVRHKKVIWWICHKCNKHAKGFKGAEKAGFTNKTEGNYWLCGECYEQQRRTQ